MARHKQVEDGTGSVFQSPHPWTGTHKLAGLGLAEPIAVQGQDSGLPGAVAVGPPHPSGSTSHQHLVSSKSFPIYPRGGEGQDQPQCQL